MCDFCIQICVLDQTRKALLLLPADDELFSLYFALKSFFLNKRSASACTLVAIPVDFKTSFAVYF